MAKKPVKKRTKTDHLIADWTECTGVQVAAICGVTPQAVSKWKGCPRGRNGKYDLGKVFAWRQERMQDEIDALSEKDIDSEGLERYRQARAEKAEIEVAQMKRDLVSRVDVETRWGRVLTHIVQAFDGLGKILAPRLARRDEKEIATEIRSEVHRVIENAREAILNDNEI
jgi:hypothetical protein